MRSQPIKQNLGGGSEDEYYSQEEYEQDWETDDDEDRDEDSDDDFEQKPPKIRTEADDWHEYLHLREDRRLELAREPQDRVDEAREFLRMGREKYEYFEEVTMDNVPYPIPLSIPGSSWILFSSKHPRDFLISMSHPTLEFYHQPTPGRPGDADKVHGDMYFGTHCSAILKPFKARKYVAPGLMAMTFYGESKIDDNREFEQKNRPAYEVEIRFLEKHYPHMMVPRELVFGQEKIPRNTPRLMEYFGVSRKMVEDKRGIKRQAVQVTKKRPRAQSPSDSWFDNYHPMGEWNRGW